MIIIVSYLYLKLIKELHCKLIFIFYLYYLNKIFVFLVSLGHQIRPVGNITQNTIVSTNDNINDFLNIVNENVMSGSHTIIGSIFTDEKTYETINLYDNGNEENNSSKDTEIEDDSETEEEYKEEEDLTTEVETKNEDKTDEDNSYEKEEEIEVSVEYFSNNKDSSGEGHNRVNKNIEVIVLD